MQMVPRFLILIAAALLVAVVLPNPGMAQEAVPSPLPFTTETQRFFLFANLDPAAAEGCGNAYNGISSHNLASGVRAYLSNNVDDPCAREDQPTGAAAANIRAQAGAGDRDLHMLLFPLITPEQPFVEGATMKGKVTMYVANPSSSAPINFGSIKPKFTFSVNGTTIATWDGAKPIHEGVQGPNQNADPIYFTFEPDFGAMPATFPKDGGARITARVTLAKGGTDTDSGRMLGYEVGFAVTEAHRGWFDIPFAPSGAPPPGPPANTTDDNATDANVTEDNATTQPAPASTPEGGGAGGSATDGDAANDTHDAAHDDHDGAPGEEQTPGFGLVAALAAIGLALVGRRVRRS